MRMSSFPVFRTTAATLLMVGSAIPAVAGYSTVATGTVRIVQQNSTMGFTPETLIFTLDGMSLPSCSNFFVISPNTTTDAQTRKNMTALVLAAKASGGQVEVAYDATGQTPCDQGMNAVYWLELL